MIVQDLPKIKKSNINACLELVQFLNVLIIKEHEDIVLKKNRKSEIVFVMETNGLSALIKLINTSIDGKRLDEIIFLFFDDLSVDILPFEGSPSLRKNKQGLLHLAIINFNKRISENNKFKHLKLLNDN